GIFAPVSPGAHPRRSTAWTPHRLCIQLPAPARSARWRGLGCVSRVLRGRGPWNGRWWQAREGRWHTGVRSLCTPVTDGTTPRVVGFGESACLLATTGRGKRRGDGGELEMPQDARDHRLLGDDGNDVQGATSAKRTGAHIQPKDAAQQPSPRPVRRARVRFLPV